MMKEIWKYIACHREYSLHRSFHLFLLNMDHKMHTSIGNSITKVKFASNTRKELITLIKKNRLDFSKYCVQFLNITYSCIHNKYSCRK